MKNKEYYAVLKGRVKEPTIFSSWFVHTWYCKRSVTNVSDRGDAHPRVTGCESKHRSFYTLADARQQMKEWNVPNPLEILKHEAGKTTPLPNTEGFYAVAYGTRPGIYPSWR